MLVEIKMGVKDSVRRQVNTERVDPTPSVSGKV